MHTVVIDGMQFSPAKLEVTVGDTVVWINKDPFPHTATSDQDGFHSKTILPERTWRFVATQRGMFPYSCALHENMHGTLLVK
jgi:plastocyanin